MGNIMNFDSIMEARGLLGGVVSLNEADSQNFTNRMQEERMESSFDNKTKVSNDREVPIAEKALLTLAEAALYTGIGQNKLREISNEDDCPFVLWNGSKRMFKREKLVSFLYSVFSI